MYLVMLLLNLVIGAESTQFNEKCLCSPYAKLLKLLLVPRHLPPQAPAGGGWLGGRRVGIVGRLTGNAIAVTA